MEHSLVIGIYVRVDRRLLDEFTKAAEASGMNRSEAIRNAMKMFIETKREKSVTAGMRGVVKSRLTLKELEELYLVSK